MNAIDLRQFVFVDTETDRLPPGHKPWEIALIFKATDLDVWMEEVFHVRDFDSSTMSEQAAAINGFHRRWLTDPNARSATARELRPHLERVLTGRTIVGSKPSFDQDALVNMGVHEVWNHHYRDIPSMFLGAYGYDVKGLQGVLDALDITNEAPHTALGDARATRDAFVTMLNDAVRA